MLYFILTLESYQFH